SAVPAPPANPEKTSGAREAAAHASRRSRRRSNARPTWARSSATPTRGRPLLWGAARSKSSANSELTGEAALIERGLAERKGSSSLNRQVHVVGRRVAGQVVGARLESDVRSALPLHGYPAYRRKARALDPTVDQRFHLGQRAVVGGEGVQLDSTVAWH